jgi:hypothetical protein
MKFNESSSIPDNGGKGPFNHPKAHTIIGIIALIFALIGLPGAIVTVLHYYGITPESTNTGTNKNNNKNMNKNENLPANQNDGLIDISQCGNLKIELLNRIKGKNNTNKMEDREIAVIRAQIKAHNCQEEY